MNLMLIEPKITFLVLETVFVEWLVDDKASFPHKDELNWLKQISKTSLY